MRVSKTLTDEIRARAGFSDGRHYRRSAGCNCGRLHTTGRGSFRVRARLGEREEAGRGTYQIVITEIPYMVQKSPAGRAAGGTTEREKAAAGVGYPRRVGGRLSVLLSSRGRAWLMPALLANRCYKRTELGEPCSAKHERADQWSRAEGCWSAEALRAWLDHLRDVLVRRNEHRTQADRASPRSAGSGYLIAYLNLDKVIKIIRTEDEPKPVLDKDVQADGVAGGFHPQYAAAQLAQA